MTDTKPKITAIVAGAVSTAATLALLAGLNPGGGPRTPESLLPDFDWEKVPRRDITVPERLFS